MRNLYKSKLSKSSEPTTYANKNFCIVRNYIKKID